MGKNKHSDKFIKLLNKKPREYSLKDKEIIIDSLQAIFNCYEVREDVSGKILMK